MGNKPFCWFIPESPIQMYLFYAVNHVRTKIILSFLFFLLFIGAGCFTPCKDMWMELLIQGQEILLPGERSKDEKLFFLQRPSSSISFYS